MAIWFCTATATRSTSQPAKRFTLPRIDQDGRSRKAQAPLHDLLHTYASANIALAWTVSSLVSWASNASSRGRVCRPFLGSQMPSFPQRAWAAGTACSLTRRFQKRFHKSPRKLGVLTFGSMTKPSWIRTRDLTMMSLRSTASYEPEYEFRPTCRGWFGATGAGMVRPAFTPPEKRHALSSRRRPVVRRAAHCRPMCRTPRPLRATLRASGKA